MPNYSSQIFIDDRNRLIIEEFFNEKNIISAEAERKGPCFDRKLRKLVLNGKWALTPEHDLSIRLSGRDSSKIGKNLILRGEIVKTTGSSLSFRVRHSDTISGLRSKTVELKGVWSQDANNRITFKVSKAKGRYDVLRFQGAWKVNKRNELVYNYVKTDLKRRTKEEKTLIFKGFWEVKKKRLVYRFEGFPRSYFAFKVALQTPSLRASSGTIKYQVGIRYYVGKVFRERRQVVTLFGTWKISKELEVSFEVAYSGRNKRSLIFTAEKVFREGSSLWVSLKDEEGKKLGIEVVFTKRFLEDAELFISLSHDAYESKVLGGVKLIF